MGENLTSLPKRGPGIVSAFNHKRVPMSCLQQPQCPGSKLLDKWNHQQLRSWVLTTHNTPNNHVTWSCAWVCFCETTQCLCEEGVAHGADLLAISVYPKMPCIVTLSKVLYKVSTSDLHSTWGHASQTPRKACSRVSAHSSKLWAYTGNWAKRRRGWAHLREGQNYSSNFWIADSQS